MSNFKTLQKVEKYQGTSYISILSSNSKKLDNDINNQFRPFFDKWSLYYHLSNDTINWDINSYKIIFRNIYNPVILIELKKEIKEHIVQKSMLFIMRNNIKPFWEDNLNKDGGFFSFKIKSMYVYNVWWDFVLLLCGERLMKDQKNMEKVNGLSINPKNGYSIIKIWLKDLKLQDYNVLNLEEIEGLRYQDECDKIPLFRPHNVKK